MPLPMCKFQISIVVTCHQFPNLAGHSVVYPGRYSIVGLSFVSKMIY